MEKLTELLWAKSSPWISLKAHMFCTGICAQHYLAAPSSAAMLGYLERCFSEDRETVLAIIGYLCAIHDIGKAHPSFQRKSQDASQALRARDENLFDHEYIEPSFRHEYYSAKIVSEIWKSKRISSRTIRIYSRILSMHHQKPNPGKKLPPVKNPAWNSMHAYLESEISGAFLKGKDLKLPESTDAACMLILSILIISDWVASSEIFSRSNDGKETEWHDLAEKAIYLYGLVGREGFPWKKNFREMWPGIEKPRPLQTLCDTMSSEALLTIIEAPMGEGKTEAALYIADQLCRSFNKRGIYMALPSQATSNQMHQRVNILLSQLGVDKARLLHGNAALFENAPSAIQTEDETTALKWTRPTRMGLLGANAVGTVDQAMSAVLLSPFSMIRIAGLVNKVLIIDEIHAYDMYMSEILEVLLTWCHDLRIPVVLLSATMQKQQRERYIGCFDAKDTGNEAYPLITQVLPGGTVIQRDADASAHYSYRLIPNREGFDPMRTADRALARVEKGGCLAVLVNTVAHAQQLFKELESLAPEDVELHLFHSRYTVERRTEIEKQCVAAFGKDRRLRPRKGILVATQVAEQSIDLDFDGMISELAPVDLLLQRAGRLHRHREYPRPAGFEDARLEVLIPPDNENQEPDRKYGASGYVYDPFLLRNTEELLKKEILVRIPEDVRGLIEGVYSSVTEENRSAWLERCMKGQLETQQAKGCTWPLPEPDSFFPAEQSVVFAVQDQEDGFESSGEASTRLGEESVRIAFCEEELFERALNESLSKDDIRQIYLNSAAIRPPRRRMPADESVHLIEKGHLAGVYLLKGREICLTENGIFRNDPVLGVSWEESR